MLENWKKYQALEVLSGNDENGNRLISLFAKDYKKITGNDICPSCNGFQEKFKNFIQKIESMSISENKNSGFVLKPMYDNITFHGSNRYYNNTTLTDELALELIEKHPKGKELFQSIPVNVKELENKTKSDTSVGIELFEKTFTVEEIKDLFKNSGIETKASSIKGLEDAFEKATEEQKEALKSLVNSGNEIDLGARFKLRVDCLISLGFERNEDNFEMEGYDSITADDVYNMSDEDFDAFVEE